MSLLPHHVVVMYQQPCCDPGHAYRLFAVNPALMNDEAFDLDAYLRHDAIRAIAQLDCPRCGQKLGQRMPSNDPDHYALTPLPPGLGASTCFRLDDLVLRPGRLVFAGSR